MSGLTGKRSREEASTADVDVNETTQPKKLKTTSTARDATEAPTVDRNKQLSILALNDAQHDFESKDVAPLPDNIKTFNSSVMENVGEKDKLNEGDTLNSVISGLKDEINKDEPTSRQETSNGVAYQVKKISIEGNGIEIVKEGGLENAVFVVDYSQHNFIKQLKEGDSNDDITLYYVLTPEVINDPAAKTNVDDPIFKKKEGVNLRPCVQTGTHSTIYAGGLPFNETAPLQNFSSKYTLALSPILDIKSWSGKVTKRQVNLKITHDKMIAEFKDSKNQNSIAQLVNFLSNLFKGLFSKKSPTDSQKQFEVASKWTQKRSGDWLQALACMDLPTRTFKDVLTDTEIPAFNDVNNIYYVTHDQIALAYALFIGVNAVFVPTVFKKLTPEKKYAAVIFKRESSTSSGPPPSYTEFCTNQLSGKDITTITTFLRNLQTARQNHIDTWDRDIVAPNKGSKEMYQTSIKTILKKALEYSYVETHVPDVSGILADLDQSVSSASAAAPPIDVCKKYKAYVAGKKLMEEHNSNGDIGPFITKLEASDHYKLIDRWSPDMNDKQLANFLFIPAIANSTNDRMKNKVATIFHTEFDKIDTYTFFANSPRLRGKEIAGLKELFAQVEVFLGQGLDPTKHFEAVQNPDIPDAQTLTDSPEEYKNLMLLANLVIANSHPEEVVVALLKLSTEGGDSSSAMVGGYTAESIQYYIQGSSIKTITRPLLTAHMLRTMTFEQAAASEEADDNQQGGANGEPTFLPILLMLEGLLMATEPRMVTSLDYLDMQEFLVFLQNLKGQQIPDIALRQLFFTSNKLHDIDTLYGMLASSFADAVCGTLPEETPNALTDKVMDTIKTAVTASRGKAVEGKTFEGFEAEVERFHKEVSDHIVGPAPVTAEILDAVAGTPAPGTPVTMTDVSAASTPPVTPPRNVVLGTPSTPASQATLTLSPGNTLGSQSPSADTSDNEGSSDNRRSRGGKTYRRKPRASKSSRRTRRVRRSGRST